jgi:hypothetical protein
LRSEAVFTFVSLRGWEAPKIPHPIFLTMDVWFFGLGLFPVAVRMGKVNFSRINYVGRVGWGWDRMLSLYYLVYIGLIREETKVNNGSFERLSKMKYSPEIDFLLFFSQNEGK